MQIKTSNTPFIHMGTCHDCQESQIAVFDYGVNEDWNGDIECEYCGALTVEGVVVMGAN